jgi:hypothetical protein
MFYGHVSPMGGRRVKRRDAQRNAEGKGKAGQKNENGRKMDFTGPNSASELKVLIEERCEELLSGKEKPLKTVFANARSAATPG